MSFRLSIILILPFLLCFNLHSEDLEKIFLQHNGLDRSAYIYDPPAGKKRAQRALLIVLHGGGPADGLELSKQLDYNQIAARENFVVAYPNGINNQWSDGRGQSYRNAKGEHTVDDVGFISKLIDQLIKDYSLNSKRIYVTGLSNGGMMALRLGCKISEKLAGIAPVIANMPSAIAKTCKPKAKLSVLLMNGTKDPLIPWSGGNVQVFGKAFGRVFSSRSTINFWADHNSCTIAGVKRIEDSNPNDNSTVRLTTYDCHGPQEVLLYAIDGGGHSFPGSKIPERPRVMGYKNMDINAAEVIWDFLKKHSRT